MAYDNEKSFALFKNDKGDNPKRPDYRGDITFEGKAYKLSGWIREVKSGKNAGQKFISGKAELDEKKNGAPQQSAPPSDPSKSAYDRPANSAPTEEPPPF